MLYVRNLFKETNHIKQATQNKTNKTVARDSWTWSSIAGEFKIIVVVVFVVCFLFLCFILFWLVFLI